MTPDTKEQLRGASWLVAFTVLAFGALALTFPPLPPPAPAVPVLVPVTLAFNASPSANVAGYKIYFGTNSHSYKSSMTVGMSLTNTIPGLTMGQKYFFAATAHDATGLESDFSNEIGITASIETIDRIYSMTSGALIGQPWTNKTLVLVTAPTQNLFFTHTIERTNRTAWK